MMVYNVDEGNKNCNWIQLEILYWISMERNKNLHTGFAHTRSISNLNSFLVLLNNIWYTLYRFWVEFYTV